MARIKKAPPTPCDQLIALRLTTEQLTALDAIAVRDHKGNRSKAIKRALDIMLLAFKPEPDENEKPYTTYIGQVNTNLVSWPEGSIEWLEVETWITATFLRGLPPQEEKERNELALKILKEDICHAARREHPLALFHDELKPNGPNHCWVTEVWVEEDKIVIGGNAQLSFIYDEAGKPKTSPPSTP